MILNSRVGEEHAEPELVKFAVFHGGSLLVTDSN